MELKTKNTIITLAVIGIVGFIVYKKFGKKQGSDGSGVGSGSSSGSGSGSSNLPPLDYDAMASDLFNAMNGYGTNEALITETLKLLRNQNDWNKLNSAFGNKKISSGRGNIFQSDFNGNLVGALKNELSSSDINDINSILSSKGISKI